MLVVDLDHCETFTSGDGLALRELLHPDKAPLQLGYSLAHATVAPGQSSRPHRLKTSEVYYILAGEGVMHVDAEIATVRAGQAIYIPPGAAQHIVNDGAAELTFLCIVDPAWQPADEEIL